MSRKPSVNHFGRSLMGGYCPQYMPDFVLHGISSDQRLKQCLMADLEHTVLVSSFTYCDIIMYVTPLQIVQ